MTVSRSRFTKMESYSEKLLECPLHNFVMDKDYKMVKRHLIALQSRGIDVNVPNHSSFTALQLALLNNADASLVQLLLEYDADTTVIDIEGNNIFHLCVTNSDADVMRTLLCHPRVHKEPLINSTNFDGYTPLILCTLSTIEKLKTYCMAEALLAAGADANVGDKKSGRTPLFHAIEANEVNMVKLLLNYNAQTKVRNFFGTSPHDAVFELDFIDGTIKRLILNKDDIKISKPEETRGKKRRRSENAVSSTTKVSSPKKPRSKPS